MDVLEKFKNLDEDLSLIGLEKSDYEVEYFCTPVGAKIIGWECEGIHYCFIEGLGETVFAVNPETAEEHYVRPLAENFEKFISGWNKEQFLNFLENDGSDFEDFAEKRQAVLNKIQTELEIEPMKNPFEYVKKIQAEFDYSKIKFSEEYYDVLGLEIPE